jgi:O-antigen biosynthesis protein WbqP
MYARFGKRLLDLLVAGAAVILSSPLLALIGGLIRLEDGPPVIYRQLRPGRDGRPFTILKFRSMPHHSVEAPSATMRTAEVTRVGRVIRRLNVDELPQLFNILRGDMSLVGPRPPLGSQQDLVELRRAGGAILLRPGLTGLAQVNAYDGMTSEAKACFDNTYAAQVTPRNDLVIIARTVLYLLRPPPTY